MRYLTDRKRAVGKGSARSGTEHHWYMQASAVGLALIATLSAAQAQPMHGHRNGPPGWSSAPQWGAPPPRPHVSLRRGSKLTPATLSLSGR